MLALGPAFTIPQSEREGLLTDWDFPKDLREREEADSGSNRGQEQIQEEENG